MGATLHWGAQASHLLQWHLLLQSTGSRHSDFSSYGVWASLPHSVWDLPGPGIKPMSPAPAGGFSTTEPPGNPLSLFKMDFNFSFYFCFHLRIWKNEERIYQDGIDALSISQNFRSQWCHVESLLSQGSPKTPWLSAKAMLGFQVDPLATPLNDSCVI